MNTGIYSTSILFIIAATLSNNTLAQKAADIQRETKPLILRSIMAELGNNMQAITHAINIEDWAQVSASAELIAEHPQPPMTERIRILSFVGSNISQFKEHDEKTHQAAKVLSETAKDNKGFQIINAFSKLQQTCLSCHQKFRHKFKQHFYPDTSVSVKLNN